MALYEPSPDEAERVVEELWLPLAASMADLDGYNALAPDAREAAIPYRRDLLAADDALCRVATAGDAWVGYVQAVASESPPVFARGDGVHVEELWVEPDHRGEGHATALMDAVAAWGRERGAERVSLSVNADNERAREFYASRGFDTRRLRLDRDL